MPDASPAKPLRILLVGNFAPDNQQSMLRFERMLAEGLARRGHLVETFSPTPRLSRFARPYRYDGWPKYLGYFDKFILFPAALRRRVRELQPDLVHLVDHGNAAYVRAVTPTPVLATCHDLLQIQLARREIDGPRPGAFGRVFQKWILGHLRRLPFAACVSAKTRADLLRLTDLDPRNVVVAPNGLNHPFRRRPSDEARATLTGLLARNSLPTSVLTGFLFNIGGTQWYKNRLGLLEIYARLRPRLSSPPLLLLAGKPLSSAALSRLQTLGLGSFVVHLGSVSADELEALYSLADGLLFPSLAEGFGWPIAEAQACGCPVFTSDRAPMTEVAGPAAVCFDPTRPEEAAQRIADAWPRREELRAAGLDRATFWSPDRMLADYENAYRQLLDSHRSPGATTSPAHP